MNSGPRILSLQHGQAGLLERLLTSIALLFSASERARYRRLANATALLRLSLTSEGGDDGSVIHIGQPRVRSWGLAGLAVLAFLAVVAWHFALSPAGIRGGGTVSSTGTHRC